MFDKYNSDIIEEEMVIFSWYCVVPIFFDKFSKKIKINMKLKEFSRIFYIFIEFNFQTSRIHTTFLSWN